jgi:hypothetical protein
MNILILGVKRSGKDKVAGLIEKHKGYTFTSSSLAAAQAILPVLHEIYGYADALEAFEDRMDKRMLWKALITLYNTPDKSALCKNILEHSDIYVGMRCVNEYQASIRFFDKIYWVDASKRGINKDETLTIPFNHITMEVIDNNGTLDELEERVKNLDLPVKETNV